MQVSAAATEKRKQSKYLWLYLYSHFSQSSEPNAYPEHNDIELYIDSNSRSSGDLADTELEANLRRHSRNFTLSPETTDYDSNCGDLDSLSNDINCATTDYGKLYTSMPVLEDGLSSGHASDTENNVSVVCYKQQQTQQAQAQQQQQQQVVLEHNGNSDGDRLQNEYNSPERGTVTADVLQPSDFVASMPTSSPPPLPESPTATPSPQPCEEESAEAAATADSADNISPAETHYGPVYAAAASSKPSSSSATAAVAAATSPVEIQEAMKEIRSAIQRAKAQPDKLKFCDEVLPADPDSPVWVPRKTATATRVDEEEADTDLETDRLLGQQDFFAEQVSSVSESAKCKLNLL